MRPILTPEQMAAADAAAIAGGTSAAELIDRAGSAVARQVVDLAGIAYGTRVAVVCGKGNNGADGYAAARRLHQMGASPVIILLFDREELSSDAGHVLSSVSEVPVLPWGSRAMAEIGRADVVVDAILGASASGPPRGDVAEAIDAIASTGAKVVSVDIPSGTDPITGRSGDTSVRADVTVVMAAHKPGLVLGEGPDRSGTIVVADIGVPVEQASMTMITDDDVAAVLAPRPRGAHKRSVGKVLVVAGSKGMAGAAILVARGAMRAGAGLVRVAVPGSALASGPTALPEALWLGMAETPEGTYEPAAVHEVVKLSEEMDLVAIGPGLSSHPETREFVRKCLRAVDRPMVVDADALNACVDDIDALSSRDAPTLITPHEMELARLLGVDLSEVTDDRLAAAQLAAERTGAVVLAKGSPTLVSNGRTTHIVTTGTPILATAGTGDVLTGMAAALAAQLDMSTAAWAAAHLHGLAGEIASRGADRGVLASEVADAVPLAIRSVAEQT